MTYQEFKSRIDQLWTKFWTGGIANPLSVIEQITYLIFIKMLDDKEIRNLKRIMRTGEKIPTLFQDFKLNPQDENSPVIKGEDVRWSNFKHLGADEKLEVVRDKVFPFIRQCSFSKTSSGSYLKDAQLLVVKSSVLDAAISMIDELPLNKDDIKGNLYEYLLSKLSQSGVNGQFRTPRHIIRMIVELVDPQKNHKICDPACGTSGFLITAKEYIEEKNSSHTGKLERDGEIIYLGDGLGEKDRKFMQKEMFYGFDFDSSMLRISAMNMMLHSIDNPNIHYQDGLSQNFFTNRNKKQAENFFDVVLANPPFKGSLDYEDVSADLLRTVKTKKTELLFIALILRMLKTGGKAGVIVPAGVLSTEQGAYKKLRKELVDDNQLEAVITMPSGVFKPYAGVATGVLIFAKGGTTKDVWFYEMEADGYSLDDKRNKIEDDDIPEIIEKFKKKEECKKSFLVNKKKLKEEDYNLLPSRYKEIEYKPIVFEHTPKEMVQKIIKIEEKILDMMKKLEADL